jgi:hypothetical protein
VNIFDEEKSMSKNLIKYRISLPSKTCPSLVVRGCEKLLQQDGENPKSVTDAGLNSHWSLNIEPFSDTLELLYAFAKKSGFLSISLHIRKPANTMKKGDSAHYMLYLAR